MHTYYVDGKFVPADKAVIPVDDLAILRGLGVFDIFRTYGGKPFFLKEHVDRLFNSAKEVQLDMPWSRDEVIDIVRRTMERNDIAESNIRIVVTGGSSPDFMTPQGNPRLLVLVTQIPSIPEDWYTDGVKIITMQHTRTITGAKSINYIPATLALKKAKKVGAIEVVYVDRKGRVLEGTTSNIFAFVGDTLVTPDKGILSGITRKVILDLAEGVFDIEVRQLSKDELLGAGEIFITGTNKGLVPVVTVNDQRIGDGKPGKNTLKLMDILQKRILGLTA